MICQPTQFELTYPLFLWMMPSTIILVLSTWMSGLLNLNDKFKLSSIAILVYNAAFVLIAAPLVNWYGPTAYGIGALLGAVLMGVFLFAGIKTKQALFIEACNRKVGRCETSLGHRFANSFRRRIDAILCIYS